MSDDKTKNIDRLCHLLESIIAQNEEVLEHLAAIDERLDHVEELCEWMDDEDDYTPPDPMDVIKEIAKLILERGETFPENSTGSELMRAIRESSR